MLRIHTVLRKWNKKNWYHILLCDNNPIGINQSCIKIVNSELLFEKYRMALKRDKNAIEIQNDDAIKRNRIFFCFMLRIFNHLKKSSDLYNLNISIEERECYGKYIKAFSKKRLFCGWDKQNKSSKILLLQIKFECKNMCM